MLDLFEIQLKCLRNKHGPSEFLMTVILSQSLGVQRELSEFHFIKERRFGLEGNLQNYNIVLLPEVKLSRTTVRRKLDDNYKLRRAVNILAEILQFEILNLLHLHAATLTVVLKSFTMTLRHKVMIGMFYWRHAAGIVPITMTLK